MDNFWNPEKLERLVVASVVWFHWGVGLHSAGKKIEGFGDLGPLAFAAGAPGGPAHAKKLVGFGDIGPLADRVVRRMPKSL